VFSLFVLIGNPIIVMIIMGAMGYRKKVSFKAGLTVAQISEFSLILVALGVSQGQVGSDVVGLVTAVGLITIAASTYLIYGSDAIYAGSSRCCASSSARGRRLDRPRRGRPARARVRRHRARPVRLDGARGAARPRRRGARRRLRPAQRPVRAGTSR
jgi:Kef-type K+ transport system membrane component KefB